MQSNICDSFNKFNFNKRLNRSLNFFMKIAKVHAAADTILSDSITFGLIIVIKAVWKEIIDV